MKKMLLGAAALLAAPLLLTPPAQATQIISLGSITGSVSFTGSGGGASGTLTATLPSLSGSATSPFGNGTFTLSAAGTLSTGPQTSGVFPVLTANTESFTFTSGTNFINETFRFTTINDGSANPHFAGTDVVTGGSAAFLADFGKIGSTSVFDFITSNIGTESLDTLAAMGGSLGPITLSSGETDITAAVPEPASLLLLGSGLLGMGLIRRRRKQA